MIFQLIGELVCTPGFFVASILNNTTITIVTNNVTLVVYTQALYHTASEYKYNFKILDAVIQVNAYQRKIFFDKIYKHQQFDLLNKQVAIWGLAFKPNTDDIREAPALSIIDNLLSAGANVKVYDPKALENVKAIYKNRLNYASDMYDALNEADFLIIVTEWLEFKMADLNKVASLLGSKTIYDGRNIYDLTRPAKYGLKYISIGRRANLARKFSLETKEN